MKVPLATYVILKWDSVNVNQHFIMAGHASKDFITWMVLIIILICSRSCDCNVTGTVDIASGCDDEGVCQCRDGVGGVKCNECLFGYYNIHVGCTGNIG